MSSLGTDSMQFAKRSYELRKEIVGIAPDVLALKQFQLDKQRIDPV